jgi:predicted DNA-binding protein with PD1-like motif
MRSRRLDDTNGLATYALVFDTGDEVNETLLAFAREHKVGSAHFTGIGALTDVELGYFEWDRKEYKRIPVREQVEVVSLVGNIALSPEGGPALHAHIVVGKSDGTAMGGHLLGGHVRPTLEVALTESPAHLQRAIDPETGLALLAG